MKTTTADEVEKQLADAGIVAQVSPITALDHPIPVRCPRCPGGLGVVPFAMLTETCRSQCLDCGHEGPVSDFVAHH